MLKRMILLMGLIVLGAALRLNAGEAPVMKQESESGITHSFIAFGNETYIVSEKGEVTWKYPRSTRDGLSVRSKTLSRSCFWLPSARSGNPFQGAKVAIEKNKDRRITRSVCLGCLSRCLARVTALV